MSLADRRRAAEHLEEAFEVSERRVCQVVGIARSTKRRRSGRIEEAALVSRIHELSEQYPRFGYRKVFYRLKVRKKLTRTHCRKMKMRQRQRKMKSPKMIRADIPIWV